MPDLNDESSETKINETNSAEPQQPQSINDQQTPAEQQTSPEPVNIADTPVTEPAKQTTTDSTAIPESQDSQPTTEVPQNAQTPEQPVSEGPKQVDEESVVDQAKAQESQVETPVQVEPTPEPEQVPTQEAADSTTDASQTDTPVATAVSEPGNESKVELPVQPAGQPQDQPATGPPRKKLIFAGLGLLLALIIGLGLYFIVFASSLSSQDALKKGVLELSKSEYIDLTQTIESGFLDGTFSQTSDFSDVSNPLSKGEADYTLNFFVTAAAKEEYVANKDRVMAKLTDYTPPEVEGEIAEPPLELNKWAVVVEAGQAQNSNLLSADVAQSFNTAIGLPFRGNFNSEPANLISEKYDEIYSFDTEAVVEEDLDGETVYKIPVSINLAAVIELSQTLNNDFDVFYGDVSQIANEGNYFEQANFYVTKSGVLKKISAEAEGATIEITYQILGDKPEISLPEPETEISL